MESSIVDIPWAVVVHRPQIRVGEVLYLDGTAEALFIAQVISEFESDASEWIGMFKARCLGLVEMYGGDQSTMQILTDAWRTCRLAFGLPRRQSRLSLLDITSIYRDAHSVMCPNAHVADFARACWDNGWGHFWVQKVIGQILDAGKMVLIENAFFFQEDYLSNFLGSKYKKATLQHHVNEDNGGLIQLIDEVVTNIYK